MQEVVPHSQLLARAQEVAEGWAREGRTKQIPAGGTVQEYKEVNARESLELADAFLSYNFLNVSISIRPNICSMFDCNLISDPSETDVERKVEGTKCYFAGPVRVPEEQRKIQSSKCVHVDKDTQTSVVKTFVTL